MVSKHPESKDTMNPEIQIKRVREYIDSLPGPAMYKNEHGVFQYLNQAYADLAGVRGNRLDFIGSTAYDLPCGMAAAAATFEEQDALVMRSQRIVRNLDIHPYAGGVWGAHVGCKQPVFDASRQVVGTIWQGTDITDAYTTAIATQLAKFSGTQNSYLLSEQAAAVSLTPRESEVLFLVLHGKTAKLTAAALGLSYRTVQQYIDTLKFKFRVRNKIELIDKAIAQGYMSQIPLSMFSRQLSVVLAAD